MAVNIVENNGTCAPYLAVYPPQASNNGVHSSEKRNYKTEMCKHFIKHYANPQQQQAFYCPHGDKCKFAHGMEELHRFKNAYEMQSEGVIESPETYLRLPCFDFVSTGSW